MRGWLIRILITSSSVVVVACLIVALWAYIEIGGFAGTFSSDNADWGTFGSYLGGVLAPVVGLVTVLILSVTLLQQQSLMSRQHRNELKQDILRLVDKAEAKIDSLLQHKVISSGGARVSVQEMIEGLQPPSVSGDPGNSHVLVRLLRLCGEYVEALMLYRDNIDPWFVYRFHRARIEEIYKFLAQNEALLEQWDRQVNLGMLKHLIEKL